MKQLKGVGNNISGFIIGKATYSKKLFRNNRRFILISDKIKKSNNYAAIISSKCYPTTANNVISEVPDLNLIKANDILKLEPDGTISIIFDSTSQHNVVFITERCNSNCIMCPQPPLKEEEDKFDLNLKYISLIDKNTQRLGITGGEPTIIGERLFDILDAIHRKLPKTSLNLLSNGIRFSDYEYTKKFAGRIKQDFVVDVPLYSDIDDIHNNIVQTKTFYKTIKGIQNLAKFNIKIGIRVVIHKMNYERLPQLSEFIYSNFPFVVNVAFMQMEPEGYAKERLSELWIDPLDYNKELEEAIITLYHRDLNVSVYNSQLCVLPENIRRFAAQSISDWKNIYIDECNGCEIKFKCPGFFSSSQNIHSRGISAIKDLQVKIA